MLIQDNIIEETLDETYPFIYNENIDKSIIKNILLVDDTVSNYNIFVNGCNNETFPIVYNNRSKKEDLINIFKLFSLEQLNRIVIVFHNIYNGPKKFINDELFFNEADMCNSNNVQFLINIITEYNIKNVDFLACNSLQFDLWNQYFNILQTNTSVIIGASDDDTGNLKYGADWVMENTNQDIKDIYFNSFIESYSDKLATMINIAGNLTTNNNIYIKQLTNGNLYYSTTNNSDDNISTGSWTQINAASDWTCVLTNSNATPTEGNRLSVVFLTNITIADISNFFIIGSNYITVNGTDKVFSINNITNYPGLIRNGIGVDSTSPSVTNIGYSNITIRNLSITGTNSTLLSFGGWVCQSYFGNTSSGTNNISYCVNNAIINTSFSGGIIGHFGYGYSTGTNIISYCINNGTMSGVSPSNGAHIGGIIGRRYGMGASGTNTIQFCGNTGGINAFGICGGIGSLRCFESSTGTVTITNCTNSGDINCSTSGGIIGGYFCISSSGINTVTKCTNSASINNTNSGGILGFVNFPLCTSISVNIVSECINTGTVIANDRVNAGGIVGCANFTQSYGTNTIINCKNTGNIGGVGCGGITGADIGGAFSDYSYNCIVNIRNCCSTGTVSNTSTMAGICGTILDLPAVATININNCYALYGEVRPPSTPSNNTVFNLSSVYIAAGTWYPLIANAILLMRINNDYIWSYMKTSGISNPSIPYQLYVLDPTTTPVGIPVVCFNKDTKILTNVGYVPIQDLRKGDLIKTSLNGFKEIDMIGYSEICNTICDERIKDKLYVCSPDKYEDVFEDLIITGCHSILVNDITDIEKNRIIETLGRIFETDCKYRLPACIDEKAQPYEKEGAFTIYHIALENENYYSNYGIYANGLLVETCSKRYLLELSEMTLIK